MLEKEIEKRMTREIKKRGGLCYKFTSPGNPGVPDRIVITPEGRIIFVELKTEIGRLAAIQRWQVDEMKKRGVEVRIVKGRDDAEAFIEEVMPNGV